MYINFCILYAALSYPATMLSRSCNYFTKEILEYVSGGGGGGERVLLLDFLNIAIEKQARSNYHPVR